QGEGGYPYAVPLSYARMGDKLIFHCAQAGHKLDAIRACNKVSFCVVGQDKVVPEEYTTYYRSVIAFGTVRELEGEEKRRAVEVLGRRYHPTDSDTHREEYIEKDFGRVCLLELDIEHLTGKEAKELAMEKWQGEDKG
ncbi:MAG: pyridoxamine 5'-phosphate oxidase family protein, partial [Oscillospiraceae bacterium]|nr:pyridoxamine 5'-phosphate oxidase family protein [Oscillospiraceae bacterium]